MPLSDDYFEPSDRPLNRLHKETFIILEYKGSYDPSFQLRKFHKDQETTFT